MAGRVFHTFVERHNDVRAERQLDLHGAFGGEKMLGAIQVRAKPNAVFRHAAQRFQAHDLEAAAVGQDGPRPRHEAVQAAGIADQLMPGTKIKMVGIGEEDLDAQCFQFLLPQALDRAPRAHGHEHGRLHGAVRRVQEPRTRARDLVLGDNLKLDGHAIRGGSGAQT